MSYSAIEPNPGFQGGGEAQPRDPDSLATYGGSMFRPVDVVISKMENCASEIGDEDCTLVLCGLCFHPCVIAEAIEQAGEGNFWLHCTAIMFAGDLACLPFLCFTVPAMNRISVRLGGEDRWVRNFLMLMFCRPCVACQLHRAVREGKAQGKLGADAGAPAQAEMS